MFIVVIPILTLEVYLSNPQRTGSFATRLNCCNVLVGPTNLGTSQRRYAITYVGTHRHVLHWLFMLSGDQANRVTCKVHMHRRSWTGDRAHYMKTATSRAFGDANTRLNRT